MQIFYPIKKLVLRLFLDHQANGELPYKFNYRLLPEIYDLCLKNNLYWGEVIFVNCNPYKNTNYKSIGELRELWIYRSATIDKMITDNVFSLILKNFKASYLWCNLSLKVNLHRQDANMMSYASKHFEFVKKLNEVLGPNAWWFDELVLYYTIPQGEIMSTIMFTNQEAMNLYNLTFNEECDKF